MDSNFSKIALLVIILFLYSGCNRNRVAFEYIVLSKTPVNMEAINTEYDDYNSDSPYNILVDRISLVFSTNRATLGNKYDFIEYELRFLFDQGDGVIALDARQMENSWVTSVNEEESCELGPYFNITELDTTVYFGTYRNGSFNLYAYKFGDVEPDSLAGLNTSAQDYYPSVLNDADLYFCSNRNGDFDIYRVENYINDQDGATIENYSSLNSSSNDKCPYIKDNVMVFVSDREGGYGGNDLWYSTYEGGVWSEPVNFGSLINSEYNEYRPIIIFTDKSKYINDMIIFSSDRPGGLGRYDLYYAGVMLDRDR